MKKDALVRVILFLLLVAVYIALIIFIPPDASLMNRFDLKTPELRLLRLSVALPLVAVWSLALYGYLSIYRYSQTIQTHQDGKLFKVISSGLGVLAFGLPLQSIIISLLDYIGRVRPDLLPTVTITENYIVLAIMLTGFYIIQKGATSLVKDLKQNDHSSPYKLWRIGLLMFGTLYVYLALTNPAKTQPFGTADKATYYLPDWLIFSTLLVPYILTWYLGGRAAYALYLYRMKAPGKLYQQALRYISAGILSVVLASMLVRFTISQTAYLNTVGLRVLFMLVYTLLLAMSIGYLLIAVGARKLHRIEKV